MRRSGPGRRSWLLLALGLFCTWVCPRNAPAQQPAEPRDSTLLAPGPDLSALLGKPLRRVEIVTLGGRWAPDTPITRAVAGQMFHPQLAREAMQELAATGRYADLRSEAFAEDGGVVLRLLVLPRRVIARVKIPGGVLPEEGTLRAAGIAREKAITLFDADRIEERVRDHYRAHGYFQAQVVTEILDTDEASEVVVLLHVTPGPRRYLSRVRFVVDPRPTPTLQAALIHYTIEQDDAVDEEDFTAADRSLQLRLQRLGWYQAEVNHKLIDDQLEVLVRPGVRIRVSFEGNRTFDDSELRAALELDESEDRSEITLLNKLGDFYRARGFLDARINVHYRGTSKDAMRDQIFSIRELGLTRVVARRYPCLSGPRSASDLDAEIDGVLSSTLPSNGVLGPPVAGTGESLSQRTPRTQLQEQDAWQTYDEDAYARAVKHLQELYRSEGYLSATVGPAALVRRACDPSLGPAVCKPVGDRDLVSEACEEGEAVPIPAALSCSYDPRTGRRCEPDVMLQIPVHIGPQSLLYDLKFEGNSYFVEEQLAELSGLELGEPASYLALERARRKLQDAYADEGFAFAAVEAELELSADNTRARAKFVIGEREQVRVRDIVVQGAERTREEVILRRARFEKGDVFRRRDARRTEELLATLGVFSSVSVLLRDPEVPAREKTVVIAVRERPSQYLEVRPGVSTGEGARLTLEYGHRNVGGDAIQFRLRTQLGYLPDVLILESEVRRKYGELPISRRLERRNTASVEFPEIGLGPLFRFAVEGVDVRDNSRDYGITKDAFIVTLSYRPEVAFTAALRGSLELNNAEIFGRYEKNALETYLRANNSSLLQRLLNVPQGQTLAVAQRISVLRDDRDNPFGATRGTLISFSAEHVNAYSLEENLDLTSHFMHYLARVAGYLRLSDSGFAFAASLGVGYNQQLQDGSQTYPDRFFFMGGADSLRGFLQASLVPEDIAQNILDPNNPLTINEVTIRGGDVSINPRTELRIPISGTWQTALFVDAGNLWLDAQRVDPTVLRYAAGSGLRAATPIGPLALDYGINLDRRPWEDFGAFHFSIGLF